jgi:NtrC-family two-component system sensor histidine kinase KinB
MTESGQTTDEAPGRKNYPVSLKWKLLLGYGVTLLVSVVLVLWSIMSLRELGKASGSILSENYRSIAAANVMMSSIGQQQRALSLVTLDDGDAAKTRFHQEEAKFLQALGRARDNITVEGEGAVVDSIQARYTAFLNVTSQLLQPMDPASARRTFMDTVVPAADKVLQSCDRLREINEHTMFLASGRAAALAERDTWTMALAGFTLVCLGVLIALVLSHRAVLPLRRLLEATKKVAAGDYQVQVPIRTRDEIGALSEEFNRMVLQLATYNSRNIERLLSEKHKGDAILRGLDDGVIVLDESHLITDINPTAAGLLGVLPGEAVGKHFLEVHRNEQLFEIIKRTTPPGQARAPHGRSEDIIGLGPEGEARFFMVSVTPVESPLGGNPGQVVLLKDVTRLKELDRLKSDFVSTASHELRGPLTSIAMAVSLLRESAETHLDAKQQKLLAAAEEELARLRALVNDLLDLSRIESGRLELSFAPMSPSAIILPIVETFASRARAAGVELLATCPDGLPDVRVDATKVAWVLSNLVGNALRYTSAGGKIGISAVQAGRQVHVSVKDDGVGIAPEDRGRIFDKFVRVGPDKAQQAGTGLGLAICKEIVRAHGGTIWVESELGEGSTFTFTLPTVRQGD